MSELEQRELARRLAEVSDVLSFDAALRLVQFDPTKAERLLQAREQSQEQQAEFARSRKRLYTALS